MYIENICIYIDREKDIDKWVEREREMEKLREKN